MSPRTFILLTTIWALVVFAGRASAQLTPTQRGLQPVEQRLEDADPLFNSRRQIDVGLGLDTKNSYVFRKPGDDQRLYYMRPGYVAEYDTRSDYIDVWGKHGELMAVISMIPPGTRFLITPPLAEPTGPARPDPPELIHARINGRVATQFRPDGQTTDEPVASALAFSSLRKSQTQSVLKAIDRVTGGE